MDQIVSAKPATVGVRFTKAGPIEFVETGATDLHGGERVVVRTPKGLELARMVRAPLGERAEPSKYTLVRVATQQDFEQERALWRRGAETLIRAQEIVNDHQLPMRLLMAQWTLDESYVTITFWAQERVDFRALVRDLAKAFRARIELHQVGVRDRAKLTGGLGRCGRLLCCITWQDSLPQVTVHMAREQELLQGIPELTGACGRLLCCVRFEYEDYLSGKAALPPPGELVTTPHGVGTVVKRDLMRERVVVRLSGEELVNLAVEETSPLNAGDSCSECPESLEQQPNP